MKDIAKAVVYTGIFLIPFIVLIISNSMFFPFITGKNFTFRILVEIVFAAWIILALYEPQYRPKMSWILVSFSALLVVMFFADLFGQYPLQSFWNNFERMEGYVTLVHTFLYLLVVGSVFSTQKIWDRYFMTIIGVAVILSLYAFSQLSGSVVINQGGGRLDGTLGNAAYMAIYTLFLIFVTVFMFVRTKTVGLRYAYAALTILFLYLLLQTETRGTSIGLAGGAFVGALYITIFARTYPTARKFALAGVVVVVLAVGSLIALKDTSFVRNSTSLARITDISFREASNRFNIWGMAFEGVKERPLLGWGQNNYNYVFNKYYRPELHGQEAWFDRVHNIVMDWLIAGGIVGTIAYFSILFSALYYLFFRPIYKKDDETFTVVERGVLIGILAGYTIHNFFVFDNIVSYIFYGTILAYIHSRVVSTEVPTLTKKVDVRVIEQMLAPAVAVMLCIVVYYVNVPAIRASQDLIQAFRTNDPETMLMWFDSALVHNSFGNQEIREQLTQRVQNLLQTPEVPEAVKEKAFKRVEEELLKQAEEKPGDARIHVFIASFYRMTNNLEQAIAQLEIARSLSPNKQLIIYEQGLAQLQKQDYEKATQFFKEAYDLGPQFMESRIYYAMSAIYSGQLGLIDELIQTPEQKDAFAMNDMAVQAVYRAKMYPRLVEMFNIQIIKKPEDPQMRTNLAYVLSEMGDTEGAIAVLNKAGEDIPTFKEQANQFIASILNTKGGVQNAPVNVQQP